MDTGFVNKDCLLFLPASHYVCIQVLTFLQQYISDHAVVFDAFGNVLGYLNGLMNYSQWPLQLSDLNPSEYTKGPICSTAISITVIKTPKSFGKKFYHLSSRDSVTLRFNAIVMPG